MAVGIHFDPEQARHFVDCLVDGRPIEGITTLDHCLNLAGACYFVLMSRGPQEARQDYNWSGLPSEYQEAHGESFLAELDAACRYVGLLTMHVLSSGESAPEETMPHQAVLRARPDGGFDIFRRAEAGDEGAG